MQPTVDAFRALARSSPWRWRTLHFTHRDREGEVEAWLRRPGELVVRPSGRPEEYVTGVPYSTSRVISASAATGSEAVESLPEVVDPEPQPPFRPDGLVAERPNGYHFDYGDPMWQNYTWTAMLDPVELSHHVRVEDLRAETRGDRETWRAYLVAETGYDPRCGGNCCELLYSEAGLMADFGDDPSQVPADWRGRRYPDGYDVALDVATGIVVHSRPIGGDEDAPWLENDIHEVDADLDAVFAGRS